MTLINVPNAISAARILMVLPFIICMLNLNAGWVGWRYLALALFVVMAASDALDGLLARRLHQETTLGRYLDPTGDKLLITAAVILLAVEKTAVAGLRLPSWVPVIAIGKDVLTVLGFGLLYLATERFVVEPRTWGKLCTLAQLIMVGFILLAPDLPEAAQRVAAPLYWLASILAAIALLDYILFGIRVAEHSSENVET